MFLLVLSDENSTAHQAAIGAPVDDIRQPRWIAIRPSLLPGHGGGIGHHRVSRHEPAVNTVSVPCSALTPPAVPIHIDRVAHLTCNSAAPRAEGRISQPSTRRARLRSGSSGVLLRCQPRTIRGHATAGQQQRPRSAGSGIWAIRTCGFPRCDLTSPHRTNSTERRRRRAPVGLASRQNFTADSSLTLSIILS